MDVHLALYFLILSLKNYFVIMLHLQKSYISNIENSHLAFLDINIFHNYSIAVRTRKLALTQ